MSYTFQQIHPTPARGKFKPELYTHPDWWAEEKYDGDRRIAQFCPEGIRFTGRRVSDVDGLLVEKTDNVPHLNGRIAHIQNQGQVEHVTLANERLYGLIGTVLDGEIIVPGGRSKDVTSIMGSKPERAIKLQQERGWVRYVVFDCLFYAGKDIRNEPLAERRRYARNALIEWNNEHAILAEAIEDGDREKFVLDVWARGGEGVILKNRWSKYGEEKQWVKVKKEFTEDVVIVGYDEPEQESTKVDGTTSITKYAARGWIGAVRFGQWKLTEINGDGTGRRELVYCGSCSGMDDALRKELSENREKHLGRVVEILANEREPTGKFRHPRWVRFRDDKNPEDCLWGVK